MDNEIQHFTFFRSWWEFAMFRDAPEKRLAFYDAIFAFVFQGVEPKRPELGKATGVESAAYDAFIMVKPIIEKSKNKARAGFLGGSTKANCKQTESKLQANRKQTPSKRQANAKQTESKTHFPLEENRIEVEENKNIDAEASSSGGGCPSVERVVAWATSVGGIPEDYARRLHADLVSVEWTDADGKRIGSWQHFFKASWAAEKSKIEASSYIEDMPRKISEDDL